MLQIAKKAARIHFLNFSATMPLDTDNPPTPADLTILW